MSITWIDTPGSTLASKNAPARFTASGEVTFISVSYAGNNVEEHVFRDGAFVYPYLGSTKSGGTFTLVRTGGWVFPPTVHVQEASSTQWSTLYEKDLRTLPNQTLINSTASPGIYPLTIDGMPWLIHFAAAPDAGQPVVAIKNGVGLVFWYAGDKSSGNTYAGMHADIRATLVPGYDPAKTTCVQLRLYRGPELNVTSPVVYNFDTHVSGLGTGNRLGAGIWNGNEAYGGPAGNNFTFGWSGAGQLLASDGYNVTKATISYADRVPPYGVGLDLYRDWVFATMASPWSMDPANTTDSEKDRNLWSFWYQRDVYGDVMPVVEDMQCAYTAVQPASGTSYSNHKMGAYFGQAGNFTSACAIQQIRVSQKAVKAL